MSDHTANIPDSSIHLSRPFQTLLYINDIIQSHTANSNRPFQTIERVNRGLERPNSDKKKDLSKQLPNRLKQPATYPVMTGLNNKWTKNHAHREIALYLSNINELNFERLKILSRTGLFDNTIAPYPHYFIQACEFMYDCKLDAGFLQQVAMADGKEARMRLMNAAYHFGWQERRALDDNTDSLLLEF